METSIAAERNEGRGLTGTGLKWIAKILMVLDHLHAVYGLEL